MSAFDRISMVLTHMQVRFRDSAQAIWSLPQEIVDEIIGNLALDFATLKSASLVQKSWTHRARRRLFYFVPIYSLSRLERWSLSIPPDPDGVASYTRFILLTYDTRRT